MLYISQKVILIQRIVTFPILAIFYRPSETDLGPFNNHNNSNSNVLLHI